MSKWMWSGMMAKHSTGHKPHHCSWKWRMVRSKASVMALATKWRGRPCGSFGGTASLPIREKSASPGRRFSVTM